jgi:hypothetical protein
MSNEEQIEIKLSKGKLVLMLVGSLVFVAAGIWLITNPSKFKSTIAPSATIIFTAGLAAILVFAVVGFFIFKKLFDDRLGLIINSKGIVDNSSIASAGEVLWDDVLQIKIVKVHNQLLLMLIVNNPESYINRQSSLIKRKAMKMNLNMYGSPISISANGLQCNFQELNILLEKKFREFKVKKQGP